MEPFDIVRLRGTDRIYRIRAIYSTYALHWQRAELSQTWARLADPNGNDAYWPIDCLELVKKFVAPKPSKP